MPFSSEDFKRAQTVFEVWTFAKPPNFLQPIKLPIYTTLTLPAAVDYEGHILYVSDGASGSRFLGSDGTSWVSLG